MTLRRIYALLKKNLLLKLRFKWNYIIKSLINPFKLAFFFIIIYSFTLQNEVKLGFLTKSNYLTFIIIGTMLHSLFNTSRLMSLSFKQEKFWYTIEGLLLSPITHFEFFIGYILSELISVLPVLIIGFILGFIALPLSVFAFSIIIFIFLCAYIFISGISFINSAFILSDENYTVLFDILFIVLSLLSCFYYPLEALPKIIHPFIIINPFYHANILVKSLWLESIFLIPSFIYLLLTSFLSLSIGIFIFRYILKRNGITGY